MHKKNSRNDQQLPSYKDVPGQGPLWRTKPLELLGGLLAVISLIVGPLLFGSYFDAWRKPLLYLASAAVLVILISTVFCGVERKARWSWLLLPLIVWPVVQGFWMWYNAWGEFAPIDYDDPGFFLQNHPLLAELADQPYPELPGSAEPGETMDRMTYIIPCLGLVWCIRALLLCRPSWFRILSLTVYCTGIALAIIGLAQKGTKAEGIFWLAEYGSVDRKLFFGTYRSPGIAACYLNIALAMGLSLALAPTQKFHAQKNTKRRLARAALYFISILILTCAAIYTGSKTGAILTALTLTAWVLLNHRTITTAFRKSAELFPGNRYLERNLVAVCVLCIGLIAIVMVADNVFSRFSEAQDNDFSSLAGRGAVNAMQIEMIKYPDWGAMGYGPGSFYPLFPYFAKGHDIEGIYVYSHNDYLQTLVEWGWLGTACFALIIIGAVYFLMRGIFILKGEYRKRHVILMRGYLIAITMCLLHALIDFPFQIESIAITMSVLFGIAWAVPALRIPDNNEETEEREEEES